jgi:hypothetical protein
MTFSQGHWMALEIPFPKSKKGEIESTRPTVKKFTHESDLHPYEYIYFKFDDREDLAGLYHRYTTHLDGKPDDMTLFRGVDRLKLIHSIITANEKGCGRLDMTKLLKKNCVDAYFPLHDLVELRELEKIWLLFFQAPWNQNVGAVKDYFGEKIGLYFLWIGHYTSWLAPAAFVGSLCWINVAIDDNSPDAPAMPYFAAFICIWSTLFLEYWKRKEKLYSMRWGMVGFEATEEVRPQFRGDKTISPIDGHPFIYFPTHLKNRRLVLTSSMICGLIVVVIGAIAAIFALKIVMSDDENFEIGGVQLGNIIASIINAFQIMVFNSIYGDMAFRFNNYENHRTQTEFENALIAKTFIFQFVNSFASMFYIAYMKPFADTPDRCHGSCMQELQTAVGTIFLTQVAMGNIMEVGVPSLKSWFAERLVQKDGSSQVHKASSAEVTNDAQQLLVSQETEISEVEKAFFLEEYDAILGPFGDYAELVIQFGFTTMFVAAFPLASLMSFVNNYIEIRVDGWKLCELCRRPEPRSIEDIGTWYTILEIIATICVFTNSAIVAYTGGVLVNYTWTLRAWIFALMSAGIFCAKYIIALLVPDVTPDVAIQLRRQEVIHDTVVEEIDYYSDEEDLSKFMVPPSYFVQDVDEDPL